MQICKRDIERAGDLAMACPISGAFSAPHSRHPMQLLNASAAELSGVSFEKACTVDDLSIANKIGEYGMSQVSERVLVRVREDPDVWFSGMFSGREDFAQDQADYFLQRFGGPSYYGDRKGPGQLIDRHAKFEMSARTAEKWLLHMDAALRDTEEVSANQRIYMLTFFRFQCYFFVAAQEASREIASALPRTQDNPPTPCPGYGKVDMALSAVQDKPAGTGVGANDYGGGSSEGEYEDEEEDDESAVAGQIDN